ncbi:DNA sulfur modification protein DndD [Chloroflexales bacterium ZM16-3]|nr:DNA sulfur modification protein DndD [Chloroflexales bacterium ZM16-3]
MYFTEFRLINFGLYPGEHVIDVRPPADQATTDRPITLIGGRNGAGKTTILEAVRLCLYGSVALGKGTKRAAYERYLLGRIHRLPGAPQGLAFAGVGVGFVHTVGGAEHTFSMRRMWQRQRSGVAETVDVTRDGAPLPAPELAIWEPFLYDLLPPGLADLFFFDGEKIQALADDPDYTALGEAIRSLLGLDLLDRLRGDLVAYQNRQRRSGNVGLDAQIAELNARRTVLDAEFALAHTEEAHLASLIGQAQSQVEAAERQLASEGGDIAIRRDNLKQQADNLRERIRRYERAVAEHAAGLLPFAIIPQLTLALKDRLELDERVEQYIQVSSTADEFIERFDQQLDYQKDWIGPIKLSNKDHGVLRRSLKQLAREIRSSMVHADDVALAAETIIHPLEKDERRELIRWLDQATGALPQQIGPLGDDLRAAMDELATVESSLDSLPAEEHVQPLLQQLSALQRELGALEVRHKTQELLVEQIRKRRAALDHEEKALSTRLMRGDDPSQRVRLAGRAQQVLVRYEEALRQRRLGELENAIVECFSRLSRKGRYIRRIAIDPATFATTLYSQKGDALPREQLSAGEKQIYAVAVLWALRLVSGRSLPIIIDTPLGRLDSDHRRRLVQHYFPHASHQVVLLSTDTEIDAALYADLAPAIARTYQLTYRPGEAGSQVEPGYFWPQAEEELAL